ncbi:hypothetical protein F5B21DRAFT_221622 [Xylaria acuta]|nr:hypothetical protein F5B21DRAFT_221622 [Xylaria acuta]
MSAVTEKQEGATAQQAALATHPNNPPAMGAPPKDYAPPVKKNEGSDEGIIVPRRITPLRQIQREAGPEPEWISCPLCKQTTTIRRVAEPSDEAKCCIACCGILGLILRCLPGSGEWWENIDIHCASCDRHIATIPPDEEIQLVRLSNRPPLPTATTTTTTTTTQKKQQPTTTPSAQKK